MEILDEHEVEDLCQRFRHVRDGSDVLDGYRQLVADVDRETERLIELHRPHLRCGPGCDACCHVARTVNVLEAYWLWRALTRGEELPPEPAKGRCALLVDRLCFVYPARPVLCRTHGLPLLYFHGSEAGVTYCELNFQHLEPASFDADEVLDMTPLNTRLLELDRQFTEKLLHRPWNPGQRVPLATLVRCLRKMHEPRNRKGNRL